VVDNQAVASAILSLDSVFLNRDAKEGRMHMEYPAKIRRVALMIASMSSFLTPFMGSSINVAAPSIQGEFNIDTATVSWVATAYLLAAAMFLVPFGKIADIHGRKRIYRYGILIDTAATVFCAMSISAPWLISFRFLQGFGDAMIFGTSIAILIAVYPPKQRGKALGISTASAYIGLSIGPFLGGILTQNFGWRSAFIFIMILDLVIIVALFSLLKGEWVGAEGEKFDSIGSTLYGLTILTVIFGFTLLPSVLALWLIGAGVAGLLAFIIRESRTRYPVLDMKFFRHNATFAFSNLAALINYSATFAVSFLMSIYLQNVRGFDSQYAGLILVSQPIVMAVFSPLAGWISDRVEPRIVSSLGMAVTAGGLYFLSFTGVSTALSYIIASLMFLGLGFAFFSSPNTNAVMSSIDRNYYGVASATLGTMRLVGQSLSLGIATMFFSLVIGGVLPFDSGYPALLTESMKLLFATFAVLCFIGIFASLARGKVRGKRSSLEASPKMKN